MQLVIPYKKHASTTSILVAQKFDKRHDDVLRTIRGLECSADFRARNFTDSSYTTAQNKTAPMYIISRDGFTMLMMAFSGPRAAKFREEFIDEFNRMEAILGRGTTPVLIPTYQKRLLSEPTKGVPDGFWSIFDKSHSIMLFVEKYIGSVNEFDLVDGSIGTRWSKYRAGKPWAVESKKYPHEYKDVRGTRPCNCYDLSELQYFDAWLNKTYKNAHLYDYLHDKYIRDRDTVMLDKVETVLPKLLKRSA